MDLKRLCELWEERAARAGPRLAAVYRCQSGAFAVVENVEVNHGLAPRQVMEDAEAAFERVYVPALEAQLAVDADYVPDIDAFHHGVVLMAAAFGAEVVWPGNHMPWVRPLLRSICEVDRLVAPNLKKDPLVRNFFDRVRRFADRTDGRIPVKLADLQSPFTVAAQLRHYEDLLIDIYDDPGRVKKLLEIVTDASLEFLRLQAEAVPQPSYPGRNYPCTLEPVGICISDDAALIPLSPAMYEEFSLPTLLRIAAGQPGLFIHSCGDYNRHVDTLLKIPNLRALQMHTGPGEIDSLPAWRKMRGRAALFSDTNDVSLGDRYKGRYWACYEEYVLPRLLEGPVDGLVLLAPPAATVHERQANVERLRERLAGQSHRTGSG